MNRKSNQRLSIAEGVLNGAVSNHRHRPVSLRPRCGRGEQQAAKPGDGRRAWKGRPVLREAALRGGSITNALVLTEDGADVGRVPAPAPAVSGRPIR